MHHPLVTTLTQAVLDGAVLTQEQGEALAALDPSQSIKDDQIGALNLLFFPWFFELAFLALRVVLGPPGGSKMGLKTKKIGFGSLAFSLLA